MELHNLVDVLPLPRQVGPPFALGRSLQKEYPVSGQLPIGEGI